MLDVVISDNKLLVYPIDSDKEEIIKLRKAFKKSRIVKDEPITIPLKKWVNLLGFKLRKFPAQEIQEAIENQDDAVITIRGNYCNLESYDKRLPIKQIINSLTYIPPDAPYIEAASRKKYKNWDKEIKDVLYDRVTKKFPTGVLDMIRTILYGNDLKPKLLYQYDHLPIMEAGLKEAGEKFSLYDYQYKALRKMISKERGRIDFPTASGKTRIGCALAYYMSKLHLDTWILTPKRMICDQWVEHLNGKVDVGIFYGSKRKSNRILGTVNVATYDMLASLMKDPGLDAAINYKFGAKCIIVDECHHVGSNRLYNNLMISEAPYRFGLSATQDLRSDEADIFTHAALGPIISQITPKELIMKGFIVKPVIHYISIPASDWMPPRKADPLKQWEMIYQNLVLFNDTRNKAVVKWANRMADENRHVIILTKEVMHAERIQRMGGDEFEWTHGEDNERYDIIKRFKQGKIKILCCTEKLIGEGLDLPIMSGVIWCGAGRSAIQIIQIVGRAMRTHEDSNKFDCKVIDFVDAHPKLRDQSLERAHHLLNKREYELNYQHARWMKSILEG